MKNKSQTTMYIVLVLMFLIIIVCNMYVASPAKEEIEKLQASNAELQARVDSIKVYYDQREEYKKQISEMTADIKAKISPFPSDTKEEDFFVLGYNMWLPDAANVGGLAENRIMYKGIIAADNEAIDTIKAEDVKRANIEDLQDEIVFKHRSVEYDSYMYYHNLASVVDTINAHNSADDNVGIQQIKYEYDITKQVMDGFIIVDFFSVLGNGNPYVPKVLPTYESGLVDLFGTFETVEVR